MDKEKKYCAAPWRSLHLNFEGQIKTCCAGNPNMLGNHDTGPIDDILQSETLKEICGENVEEGCTGYAKIAHVISWTQN